MGTNDNTISRRHFLKIGTTAAVGSLLFSACNKIYIDPKNDPLKLDFDPTNAGLDLPVIKEVAAGKKLIIRDDDVINGGPIRIEKLSGGATIEILTNRRFDLQIVDFVPTATNPTATITGNSHTGNIRILNTKAQGIVSEATLNITAPNAANVGIGGFSGAKMPITGCDSLAVNTDAASVSARAMGAAVNLRHVLLGTSRGVALALPPESRYSLQNNSEKALSVTLEEAEAGLRVSTNSTQNNVRLIVPASTVGERNTWSLNGLLGLDVSKCSSIGNNFTLTGDVALVNKNLTVGNEANLTIARADINSIGEKGKITCSANTASSITKVGNANQISAHALTSTEVGNDCILTLGKGITTNPPASSLGKIGQLAIVTNSGSLTFTEAGLGAQLTSERGSISGETHAGGVPNVRRGLLKAGRNLTNAEKNSGNFITLKNTFGAFTDVQSDGNITAKGISGGTDTKIQADGAISLVSLNDGSRIEGCNGLTVADALKKGTVCNVTRGDAVIGTIEDGDSPANGVKLSVQQFANIAPGNLQVKTTVGQHAQLFSAGNLTLPDVKANVKATAVSNITTKNICTNCEVTSQRGQRITVGGDVGAGTKINRNTATLSVTGKTDPSVVITPDVKVTRGAAIGC